MSDARLAPLVMSLRCDAIVSSFDETRTPTDLRERLRRLRVSRAAEFFCSFLDTRLLPRILRGWNVPAGQNRAKN